MSKGIGIVDYGGGNLRSVQNALKLLGTDAPLVRDAAGLAKVDAVIFPGQGAFGDSMQGLTRCGLVDPLRGWLREGRPFLGICVGYQLLFESSEEEPGVAGLGVLKGRVVKFQRKEGMKVPHMGWNTARLTVPDHPQWTGLPAEPFFYFVHSYFPAPEDPGCIAAVTDYGGEFACAAQGPGFFATQFHPEKSQENGLRLIGNFVRQQGV